MTDDLSSDARALLDAARSAHDPIPDDKSRVKRAVLASIATIPLAAASAEAANVSAGAVAAPVSSAVKIGVGFVAAGVLATTIAVWPSSPPPKPAAPAPSEVVVVDEVAPPAPAQDVVVEAVQTADEPAVVEAPNVVPVRRVKKATPRPTEPTEPTETTADVGTLAAETALIVKVRVALREQRPADVLDLAAAYEREFADGVLLEEALAARVLALCALDRNDEARVAKSALVAKAPNSIHLGRVESACR